MMKQKRAYLRPELRLYGSVRNLTGGSNNMGNDGFGGMTGGGLGGFGMMGMMSDRRLKQNIRKIGEHPLGFGLYLFDYRPEFRDLCEGRDVFGAMADEVAAVCPGAVAQHPSGYAMVDCAQLGIAQA
uniref:tail fiber domain-containing protein n=1 Tax=uncultured Erythrobacter sp. TaxID=263913 RepID=UPI002631233C|nr:tail fiber domain-containing protein [uncultured Erythrobacter sp.]